jgi:hypothetical protein
MVLYVGVPNPSVICEEKAVRWDGKEGVDNCFVVLLPAITIPLWLCYKHYSRDLSFNSKCSMTSSSKSRQEKIAPILIHRLYAPASFR